MACLRTSIALCNKDLVLHVDELAKPRLFYRICEICAGGTNEADIGDIGCPCSVDEFKSDVILFDMCRWNETDGINIHLLEGLRHLTLASRLVLNDESTQAREILTKFVLRIHSQAGNGAKALGKVWVREEKLSYEVACLTVNCRNAEFTRHNRVLS